MDIKRWQNFTKRQQILTIKSEFMRAVTWQNNDQEKFLLALERALELIDLTLSDKKWKNNLQMLLVLREEVAKFYTGQRRDSFFLIYNAL